MDELTPRDDQQETRVPLQLCDELETERKRLDADMKAKLSKSPVAEVPSPRGSFATRPVAASATQRSRRQAKRTQAKLTTVKNGHVGEILLFGTIGEDWYGEGITAVKFNESLAELGNVTEINLRINSGGGDVFDATAIYSMLVKHDATINVQIEGVAASAATLIAMAGDGIEMTENAHFMIHRASGGVYGNESDLLSYLKLLQNADKLLRVTYSARTGLTDEELVEMLATDNWMTAQEAMDNGFVDSIVEAKTVKADAEPDNFQPKHLAAISADRLALAAERLADFQTDLIPPMRIAAKATPTGDSPAPVTHEEITMNKKLRAKCEAAGMDAKLTDEQAQEWLVDNMDKVTAQSVTPPVVVAPVEAAAPLTAEAIADLWDKREAAKAEAAAKLKAEFESGIDGMITLAFDDDAPKGLRAECVLAGDTTAANALILAAKAERAEEVKTNPRVSFAKTQPRDTHIAAMQTGLSARCLGSFMTKDDHKLSQAEVLEKHLPKDKRPEGWEDFRHMPLIKLAEECLIADGYTDREVRKMTNDQISQAALGFRRQARVRADGALHTTGSLATITQDAINKSLLAGYEEAPATWRGPFRQAESVSDFKTIHRISLGAVPNLPVWEDNTAPNQVKLSNQEETYAVEARAQKISFSWRLVINDDLGALSRQPQLQGDAAARTVNALAWAQLTSNPTMADGQALFLESPTGNRKRTNYLTEAGVPSNATIGVMKSNMRLMRGLNTPEGDESEDILNLTPTFIMGPTALEETIMKQVFSGADPADNKSNAVYNTARTLTPVIEPLLDAYLSTAWFLAASPTRVDTIEVTFLAGQETPITHEYMDDETMAMCYTIIQTCAAKAIDHRGLQQHKGAT